MPLRLVVSRPWKEVDCMSAFWRFGVGFALAASVGFSTLAAQERGPAPRAAGEANTPTTGEVNAGQANAGQPNAGPLGPLQPVAPFQLSPQQQQFVDELLAAWEKHSGGIKTFECDFT